MVSQDVPEDHFPHRAYRICALCTFIKQNPKSYTSQESNSNYTAKNNVLESPFGVSTSVRELHLHITSCLNS